MPTSEKQKGAAGAAYGAVKKGAAAVSKLKGPAKSMAKSMSKPELKKMATGPIKKESVKESITMEKPIEEAPMMEAQITDNITFWVVEKPKSPTDDPMELYFETNPLGFANQIMGGLMPEELLGFYANEDEASNAAHDQVTAVMEAAKQLEEKKHMAASKIQETIKKLQKEVNRCMEEGDDMKAQEKLQRIAELRSKHQMVEASKKEIEKSEEK